MNKYAIFIFALLMGSLCLGGSGLAEPTEMFSCKSNPIIGYEGPDAKSKSIKIECRNIVSSHPAMGPGPYGKNRYYENRLIWETEKNGAWIKVRLEDSKKFYWINAEEATFKKSIKTVQRHFSNPGTVYALFGQWDGKLYKNIGSKEFIDSHIKLAIVGDYSVTIEVKEVKVVDDKVWFNVQLYDDSLCDAPSPPQKTISGWVHFLNDNDEPIIGDEFCG